MSKVRLCDVCGLKLKNERGEFPVDIHTIEIRAGHVRIVGEFKTDGDVCETCFTRAMDGCAVHIKLEHNRGTTEVSQ